MDHAHPYHLYLTTTVREGLKHFVATAKADELMIVTSIYDLAARIRSYELVAETWTADAA